VIGLAILLDPEDLRGEDLRYLRTLFGMTQKELAEKLVSGGRRETVAEWEKKKKAFDNKFDELARRIVLLHLFRSEVLNSSDCFLDENHRERIQKYSSRLVDDILDLMKPIPKAKKAVFLRHRPKLKEWDISLAS
jgi:transcriptional regulator with XRE-family HTH domain